MKKNVARIFINADDIELSSLIKLLTFIDKNWDTHQNVAVVPGKEPCKRRKRG